MICTIKGYSKLFSSLPSSRIELLASALAQPRCTSSIFKQCGGNSRYISICSNDNIFSSKNNNNSVSGFNLTTKRTLVSSSKNSKSISNNSSSSSNRFAITGTLSEMGPIVGAFCEVEHAFSQEEVNNFAAICGDNNPLHTDVEFAKTTMFKGTIVHGILVSSLFSTLFGRSIIGSVYVSQSLKFRKPVHIGTTVKARMEVISVADKSLGKFITCKTQVTTSDGAIAVDGEALTLIPSKKI